MFFNNWWEVDWCASLVAHRYHNIGEMCQMHGFLSQNAPERSENEHDLSSVGITLKTNHIFKLFFERQAGKKERQTIFNSNTQILLRLHPNHPENLLRL